VQVPYKSPGGVASLFIVPRRSVEKGTARNTNLHCMPSSFLSQALGPSRYQTRGRYGVEPARGAIIQYCLDGESFAQISRADEGLGIHVGRYGVAPFTCQ
jgi:hypothetical protein